MKNGFLCKLVFRKLYDQTGQSIKAVQLCRIVDEFKEFFLPYPDGVSENRSDHLNRWNSII